MGQSKRYQMLPNPQTDDRESARTYSELHKWRLKRILLRLFIILMIAPPTIYFVSNLIAFGKLTGLTTSDFSKLVRNDGIPFVKAINAYQVENGRLPDDPKLLVPKYLYKLPWAADIQGSRAVIYDHTPFSHYVTYDLDHPELGWIVHSKIINGPVPINNEK